MNRVMRDKLKKEGKQKPAKEKKPAPPKTDAPIPAAPGVTESKKPAGGKKGRKSGKPGK